MSLAGSVAVVTGCSRAKGIGFGICSLLRAHGMHVIGIDVQQPEKEVLACTEQSDACKSSVSTEQLPQSGGRFLFSAASVSNVDAVNTAVRDSLASLGQPHIHLVVNNAGLAVPDLQTPPPPPRGSGDLASRVRDFETFIDGHLKGAFIVTEVCSQWFPTGDGAPRGSASVINIASTRARQSEELAHGSEGYAAAKGGMLGLTHAQASSLRGIARVNTILPGWINTDSEYVPSAEDDAWHWGQQRVGAPQDIAEAVLFLADGSKSGFITGSEITIDGGVSRKMVYPE